MKDKKTATKTAKQAKLRSIFTKTGKIQRKTNAEEQKKDC